MESEASAYYTLRIKFSGLCAYVPRGDNDRRPERIDVLLVKAPPAPDVLPTGEVASIEGGYEADAVHLPVLRFNLKNLLGTKGILGDANGYWLLDGEDVSLFHANEDGSDLRPLRGKVRMKRRGRLPGSDKPDKNDDDQVSDIFWLPKMWKVLPEAGEIEPTWVMDPNPSRRIAARILLEKGRMRSWKISEYRREHVVARFVPAHNEGNPYAQALAHWVAMIVKVPRGRVIVVKARRYEMDIEREVVLTLGEGETDIEVSVTNLCCGYALTDQAYGIEVPAPDDDFEYLYRLCKYYDDIEAKYTRLPIPMPLKYRANKQGLEGGGIDPLRCTGGRFRVVPL